MPKKTGVSLYISKHAHMIRDVKKLTLGNSGKNPVPMTSIHDCDWI